MFKFSKWLIVLNLFYFSAIAQEKSMYDPNESLKDVENVKGAVKELTDKVDRLDETGKVMYVSEQTDWRFGKNKNILSKRYYYDTHYNNPQRLYTVDETFHYENERLTKISQRCEKYNVNDSIGYVYDESLKLRKILSANKTTHVTEGKASKLEIDSIPKAIVKTIRRDYVLYNGKYRLTKEMPGDIGYVIQRSYTYQKNKKTRETFEHKSKDGKNDYRIVRVIVYNRSGVQVRDSIFSYQTMTADIQAVASSPVNHDATEAAPEYAKTQKKEIKSTLVQSYEYDPLGNLVLIRAINLDNAKEMDRREIKYDMQGNWTEIMFYFMGNPSERHLRTISYY